VSTPASPGCGNGGQRTLDWINLTDHRRNKVIVMSYFVFLDCSYPYHCQNLQKFKKKESQHKISTTDGRRDDMEIIGANENETLAVGNIPFG